MKKIHFVHHEFNSYFSVTDVVGTQHLKSFWGQVRHVFVSCAITATSCAVKRRETTSSRKETIAAAGALLTLRKAIVFCPVECNSNCTCTWLAMLGMPTQQRSLLSLAQRCCETPHPKLSHAESRSALFADKCRVSMRDSMPGPRAGNQLFRTMAVLCTHFHVGSSQFRAQPAAGIACPAAVSSA